MHKYNSKKEIYRKKNYEEIKKQQGKPKSIKLLLKLRTGILILSVNVIISNLFKYQPW